MARLVFPQDRTIFLYTGPGEPIRQPWTTQMTAYLDRLGTELANITTIEGDPIVGSVVYVGEDGLLPVFLGPTNGAQALWLHPPEGEPYMVEARLYSQIDDLRTDAEQYADDVALRILDTLVLSEPGSVGGAMHAGTMVLHNDTGFDWQIIAVRYSVRTSAPEATQASLRIDGVNQVPTQAQIAGGALTGVLAPVPDLVVAAGEALDVWLGAVGGTYITPPSDFYAQVVVRHVPAATVIVT